MISPALRRAFWPAICFVALTALLVWRLAPEWRLIPQYRYGFLVPAMIALLVWHSFDRRPAARPRGDRATATGLVAIALLLFPVDVVVVANPDWRLALWVYALAVFAGWCLVLRWAGGWGWYFAGSLGLIFFAVPWPSGFEQSAVQGLMRVVASITGELCNLIGVPVESRGNVLRLASGQWVGVEDACSGVRSLQSSLMAAYFLSRWEHLSVLRSLALMVLAAVLSFAFNIARATALTLLGHHKGAQALERWHDFAGNSVAVLVFVVLLLIALRMGASGAVGEPCSGSDQRSGAGVPVVVSFMLLGVVPFSAWWFGRGERGGDPSSVVEFAWGAVPGEVEYLPIAQRSRNLLRYSEGEHGMWRDESGGIRFDLFYFEWGKGMISSFAEIHRPDICLPASGFALTQHEPEWATLELGEHQLPFERFTFEEGGSRLYVYFSVWDERRGSGQSPLVSGVRDRLANAAKGRRVRGRRVLQLLVSGATSDAAGIDREVETLLGQVLRDRRPATR